MAVDLAFTPERIRKLRETLKVTQEEFGRRAGVTVGAVSLWESGGRKPSDAEVLQRLLEMEREAIGA